MTLFDAVVQEDADALVRLAAEARDLNAQFEGGRTALHEAAMRGHIVLVELLLAAGADPSLHDFDDETAMVKAAVHGQLHVVRVLSPFASEDERDLARSMLAVHRIPFNPDEYQGGDGPVPEWKRTAAEVFSKLSKLLGDDRAEKRLQRVHRSEQLVRIKK